MDAWTDGARYEPYVGRWSRALAPAFLAWALPEVPRRVLDVGCGTGALSDALVAAGAREVVGVDRSEAYVAHASRRVPTGRFVVGDAQRLDVPDASFDAAVSGLVLNFLPDPAAAVAGMRRAVRPGGVVAAYVWDYADRMELMRRFWDAAIALDPGAAAQDERPRFPLCAPDALRALFQDAGLARVETSHVDQPTVFRDFDDYWTPFLGGQGPAPAYCMGLPEADRARLRERLRDTLPTRPDGTIPLVARAWTVKGTTGADGRGLT